MEKINKKNQINKINFFTDKNNDETLNPLRYFI